MFTGLIQEIGRVEWHHLSPGKMEVLLSAPELFKNLKVGDSVSVNGVCLTAEEVRASSAKFFISAETLERSNLGQLKEGSRINLELAVQAQTHLGGHYVQGHVDACGEVIEISPGEKVYFLKIRASQSISRYLVEKASVAINGVSLTVNTIDADEFSLCLIPKTWEKTNLSLLQVGDRVNIEVDILSKYVEKHLQTFLETRINKK